MIKCNFGQAPRLLQQCILLLCPTHCLPRTVQCSLKSASMFGVYAGTQQWTSADALTQQGGDKTNKVATPTPNISEKVYTITPVLSSWQCTLFLQPSLVLQCTVYSMLGGPRRARPWKSHHFPFPPHIIALHCIGPLLECKIGMQVP